MGFMGFGMQRWIYTQKPKRFLSWERKPFGNSANVIKHNSYTLKFKNDESSKIILEPRSQHNIYPFTIKRTITVCLAFLLSVLLYFQVQKINHLTNSRIESPKNQIERKRFERVQAYTYLIKNGKLEIEKGNLNSAHYDLMLAKKLYPSKVYHNVQLANLYIELCHNEQIYCAETKVFTEEINQVFEGHKYLLNMKTL